MNIVTNNLVLTHLKKVVEFKVDLGLNLKGAVQANKNNNEPKIKIRDEFVKKYQNINNKIIIKFGNIGTLKFYEDFSLKTEMHIYKDEQIFEIIVDMVNLKTNPTEYLVNILKALDDPEKDENIKDVIYSNMPENLERPDMLLPKEQYIEQLLKRREIAKKL